MMMIKQARGVLLVTFVLLVACNDAPVSKRVGVSGGGDDVRVHFVVCDEDRYAASVSVIERVGDGIGDGDDPTLWQISSATPNRLETFTVGEVPNGYREEVALADPLPTGVPLTAQIEFMNLESLIGFELQELQSDKILSQKGQLDPDQFADYGRGTCPS